MGDLEHHIDVQSSPPPDVALAELARAQWGVVSRAQLRELGFGRGAIARRLEAGRLHVVHRGVYAVGHTALTREGRWLAAVLASGPSAALSHRSAAAHWGLLHSDQTRIDVTAARSRGGAPGIRLHRTRFLNAHNTTTHRGIPITTVARTLLDLAAKEQPARLERAVAQAIRQNVYDHQAITEVLATSNGHRGGKALSAATAREPKLTRSDWEARVLALIRAAHLPEPLVNHTLDVPDHGPCEADFYWPTNRLIIETDSWQHHGSRASFEADRAKDAALTA
ncbi:MAG TPA: type IV toxin-antitoxin system AbiEi family antitoxin domain-containing protein, partial [Kofleriaceae bacterium]|nr:type IV toxin-antitoxin system AbiEi family antitoxin domain-containing protein [Kofleriaceae bacterium]